MSNGLDEPDGATPLDADEKEGLHFAHITSRGELEQLGQANIVEGMQWLKKQNNKDALSEGFVGCKGIHQARVIKDIRLPEIRREIAQYRTGKVKIPAEVKH